MKQRNFTGLPLKKPKRWTSSPMRDTDGDGYPNIVDCQPYNKNKQGRIGDWLKKKGEEYRERSAERRERKIETIEQKARLEEAKSKLDSVKYSRQREKISLGRERVKLMAERQKAMPQLPGMGFGGSPSQPMPKNLSPWTPSPMGFGSSQQAPTTKTKKRKTTKRKKSSGGKTFTIRVN